MKKTSFPVIGFFLMSILICYNHPVYSQRSNKKNKDKTVYMLTYDHGGLILWGSDHFQERLQNAISWLDKYPSFKIGLENEGQIYDYFNDHEPQLLEEINEYLQKYRGRFGIGSCTYGQPLSTFINEESNIRQIDYALKASEKYFDYRPPVYLMSEHAMHSQIPQIVKGFGFDGAIMRTHYMMYGYNPTFDTPIGWWKGLDGTKIATIPTYDGEGAAFGKTTVDTWILTRYPSRDSPEPMESFRKQFKHINPLLATRADDSGLRKEELVAEYEKKLNYQWILLDDLLEKYPTPTVDMPTKPNDFTVRMPWGYCGNEIWNMSRKAEVSVLTAERLAAFEILNGGKSHEEELDKAWKDLLLAQHHDIQICGLLSDARRLLPASIKESENVIENTMAFFAKNMSGDGIKQVVVFNPHSWNQKRWITTEVSLSKGEANDFEVRNGNMAVPSMLISSDRYSDKSIQKGRITFLVDLDPLSIVSFSLVPMDKTTTSVNSKIKFDEEKLIINTPLLEIKLSQNGGFEYVKDIKTGKLITQNDERSGYFRGLINGNPEESMGRWIIDKSTPNAPWCIATEYGFISDIPYQFKIRIYDDSPVIECKVSFDFNGQKIGLLSDNERDSHSPFVHEEKLRFSWNPALVQDVTGIRDLPFAISETDNKYIEGNYWTAVSDGDQGIAFFNKGNMGTVREEDGSISIPLAYAMYYIWGTRMLHGQYSYEFAIYPFSGKWQEADIHRKSLAYNFPLPKSEGKSGNGPLGDKVNLLNMKSENVILSALYPSDGGIYTRFYEFGGLRVDPEINWKVKNTGIREVDLLGEEIEETSLKFKPWEIKSYFISY
ncbi:glycosyl hydrolase-related protein [Bacteroidota bacterium]